MPLYEYACRQCGHHFDKLVRPGSAAAPAIVCPACQSEDVRKKLSTFSARGSGEGSWLSAAGAASCSSGST